MPAIDTAAWLRPPFTETMFTVTNWDTAADKADFANTLCRFIAADFKKELFTQKLYRRLNLSFGFIAQYNINDFLIISSWIYRARSLSWKRCSPGGPVASRNTHSAMSNVR